MKEGSRLRFARLVFGVWSGWLFAGGGADCGSWCGGDCGRMGIVEGLRAVFDELAA